MLPCLLKCFVIRHNINCHAALSQATTGCVRIVRASGLTRTKEDEQAKGAREPEMQEEKGVHQVERRRSTHVLHA